MFLVMLARSVLVLARSLTRAPSISEMFENPLKMLWRSYDSGLVLRGYGECPGCPLKLQLRTGSCWHG